ncbi:MAG: hypothetical protein M3537_11055 [Chloroflexota bacterium]|nr:hypothetical protein [Chloroflexota bacterium]
MTEILTVLDWNAFDPATRQTLQTIGSRLAEGSSQREIAKALGVSEEQVAAKVAELRVAMLEMVGRQGSQLSVRALERVRRYREEGR